MVGSMLEQKLDHCRMTFRGRPHESCLSAKVLAGIHVSSVIEQRLHRVRVADAGCRHEYRFPLRCDQGIRIGAGLEQPFDQSTASIRGGFRKGGRSVAVYSPDV